MAYDTYVFLFTEDGKEVKAVYKNKLGKPLSYEEAKTLYYRAYNAHIHGLYCKSGREEATAKDVLAWHARGFKTPVAKSNVSMTAVSKPVNITMKIVKVATQYNPETKVASWAAALVDGGKARNFSGSIANGTQAKAALAAIEAAAKEAGDCSLVVKFGKRDRFLATVDTLIANNGRTRTGAMSVNADAIMAMKPIINQHNIIFSMESSFDMEVTERLAKDELFKAQESEPTTKEPEFAENGEFMPF